MAARLDSVVLDVGQGSGNFLELYNANDQLTNTALLDLGSKTGEDAAAGAVRYVIAQLNNMPNGAQLDVVLLSHSDSDHINLVAGVLDAFSPNGFGKPQLVVGLVIFAGERSKYSKRRGPNLINTLETFTPQDGQPHVYDCGGGYSSFLDSPWRNFGFGRVNLYILVSNAPATEAVFGNISAPTRRSAGGYAINTNSIVAVTDYNYPSVITGDATGMTLAWCNQIIARKNLVVRMFVYTFMVTAPHHGSASTTFDLLGMRTATHTEDQVAVANLTQFVDNLYASNLSVSAEQVARYRHPSMRVMQFFWPHLGEAIYADPLLPISEGHWTNAYFPINQYQLRGTAYTYPANPGWYTVQTDRNIFTNLYYVANQVGAVAIPPSTVVEPLAVPPNPIIRGENVAFGMVRPPLGIIWTFRIPSSGARTVIPTTNRAAILAGWYSPERRISQVAKANVPRPVVRSLPPLAAPPPTRMRKLQVVR